MNIEEISKNFAILEEVETSAKLIRLGLGELQNLNISNNFHFLPFQLLSQGFERLMKSHICLGYYKNLEKFPDFKYIKNLGHDLEKLLSEILSEYFIDDDHQMIVEDKEFLTNNLDLKELLFILSEFGKFARYHNFDIITGSQKPSINPKEYWVKFENRIMLSNPEISSKLGNWEVHDEIYGDLARYIIVIFEKFVSAISRQFAFGHLGDRGRQLSVSLTDFNLLYPKKFGITDYRQITTRYKEKVRKVHKRTFIDYLKRKFNPNYKHQKIRKSAYNDDWPFYADEVIIECRYERWCIVSIDGYDYALNGNAKGRYKLENTHDAGMAILGKGTGDFIKMALNIPNKKL